MLAVDAIDGCEHQATYRALDRQLFYFSPVRPHGGTIVLRLSGANGKDEINSVSALPVYFRVESESGAVVREGRLFLYGRHATEDIILQVPSVPAGSPEQQVVWRLYTASNYGPRLELPDGADELLLAVRRDHLAAIWQALPQVTTSAMACPVP